MTFFVFICREEHDRKHKEKPLEGKFVCHAKFIVKLSWCIVNALIDCHYILAPKDLDPEDNKTDHPHGSVPVKKVKNGRV